MFTIKNQAKEKSLNVNIYTWKRAIYIYFFLLKFMINGHAVSSMFQCGYFFLGKQSYNRVHMTNDYIYLFRFSYQCPMTTRKWSVYRRALTNYRFPGINDRSQCCIHSCVSWVSGKYGDVNVI